jgi:hypothetical protein
MEGCFFYAGKKAAAERKQMTTSCCSSALSLGFLPSCIALSAADTAVSNKNYWFFLD